MAKILILYYSQFGSARLISEVIEKCFNRVNIITKRLDITVDKEIEDLDNYKIIVFCSPVYFQREPLIWDDYISKLGRLDQKAGYIFSTYSINPGQEDILLIDRFKELTIKKGLKIIGSIGTICEETYPPLRKRKINSGRPNLSDLKRIEDYVQGIISDIKNRRIDRAIYDITYKETNMVIRKMSAKLAFTTSPKVVLNERSCYKCKLCIEPCPMQNITFNQKIYIGKNCMKCYKCYTICPNKAIEVGWDKIDGLIKRFSI
jgi:NAD-dependent dihydropyrimidine dehydrogenase PreA subunit/flavodoxin